MYSLETKIRVRYGETDQMGFVYYGVYAQYYEVGRVELLRSLGINYKEMEDEGSFNLDDQIETENRIANLLTFLVSTPEFQLA